MKNIAEEIVNEFRKELPNKIIKIIESSEPKITERELFLKAIRTIAEVNEILKEEREA